MVKQTLSILFVVMLLVGCHNDRSTYLSLQGAMIGTTYHIKADLSPAHRSSITERIVALDHQLKSEMSLFDADSQLSRINRGESSEITPWIEFNIRLADSISRLSAGVYDITIAPLTKAWGFGAERRIESPNVDSLLTFVGYEGLTIEEGEITKRDERMQIDLNSIAKGFATDRLADIVESYGCCNYMIEIGGEIRLRGVNPKGSEWRVGVESPIDGNMSSGEYLERVVGISPDDELRAIATSGNYRRYYLNANGEKIVHTIDPRSGESLNSRLLSVTVLAPTCAEADAYATMFMAAGEDEAESLAESVERCEVYFIYSTDGDGYREYLSEGMRQRVIE